MVCSIQTGGRKGSLILSYNRAIVLHQGGWPLHDIVIADIVWCIAYTPEVGRGVSYGPIIVQSYCTRVGNAGVRGE